MWRAISSSLVLEIFIITPTCLSPCFLWTLVCTTYLTLIIYCLKFHIFLICLKTRLQALWAQEQSFLTYMWESHRSLYKIFSYKNLGHTSIRISHRYTFVTHCPWTSLPQLHLAPLGYQRASDLSPLHHMANFHRLSTYGNVYFPCYSLYSSHPLLSPLCPQVCSLCLCLHCCTADRFISPIFLDSIYMR